MVLTTLMTFFVVRYLWNYPAWLCWSATLFFLSIELVFLSSNILKVFSGGWFTLAIAAAVFTVMLTWKQGRRQLSAKLREDAIDLKSFLEAIFVSPPQRVSGTAVFLSSEPGMTPNALLHNLKHNKVLHEQNIFVTVKHHEVPWVGFDQRVQIEALGQKCWQVSLHFGFKNEPDVPEALKLLKQHGVEIEDMETSYFPVPRHHHPHHRFRAWPCGARSCLPACTAMRPPRRTSCTCRQTVSWNWAPRSRFDPECSHQNSPGRPALRCIAAFIRLGPSEQRNHPLAARRRVIFLVCARVQVLAVQMRSSRRCPSAVKCTTVPCGISSQPSCPSSSGSEAITWPCSPWRWR